MTGIASRDLRSTEKNLGTDKGPSVELKFNYLVYVNHSGIFDEPDRIIDMTDLGGT